MTPEREALVKFLRELKLVFAGDALPHWQPSMETTGLRGWWLDRIDNKITALTEQESAAVAAGEVRFMWRSHGMVRHNEGLFIAKTAYDSLQSALQVAQQERDKCADLNDRQAKRVYEAEQRAEAMRKDAAMWRGFQALINATDKTFSINRGQLACLITQIDPMVDKALAEGEKK